MAHSFLIIGLSTFGQVLAQELYELEEEVVVIDNNKEKIQNIKDNVTEAVFGDATDKKILKKIIDNVDITAIVSLGENFEENVMVVYFLKELGIQKIVAKTNSLDRARVLTLVGASEILHPERDMAFNFAERLKNPNVLQSLPMNDAYSVIEFETPKSFIGQTLASLRLGEKYQIQVLAIKQTTNQELLMNPKFRYKFKESDLIVALANKEKVNTLLSESK